VVAVGKNLNWKLDLQMSSWIHVVVGPSGKISVFLGKYGDRKCGFDFASTMQLADFVFIFGDKLGTLDVNYQNVTGNLPLFSYI
jgi:hypothetical protein